MKGCHTFPNSVSEVPHISINFILSTFNCEEIKHLSFRKGLCSGNSTISQYPVTMEDKKPHNIHWHSWEPRYQRLQKYGHKRLNLVLLGREVECNSCKHWAAEVCTTSAWYWQSCYKPLLISVSTSTNSVIEINSLFTYAKHSTPKPSFAKKLLAKANWD
jgi:hypothetical protein